VRGGKQQEVDAMFTRSKAKRQLSNAAAPMSS
jgi:hypothetical protein